MAENIWPEAKTRRIGNGDIGIVIIHGFTGCTASVSAWAEALAEQCSAEVIVPRLSGHGTHYRDLAKVSWTDWYADVERAYRELASRHEQVFVGGLSMGGALALRLAEQHDVAGVLLVNPAIASRSFRLRAIGLLRHLVDFAPAIGSDICKPGVNELSYDKTSLAAAYQMTLLWREIRNDLAEVTAPVLLFKSAIDHVVDSATQQLLVETLPQVRQIRLEDSYHVATIDNDAELIFTSSASFVSELRSATRTCGQ